MSNAVLMCRICIKYQSTIRAVCTYARVFRKRPGCPLIGACALLRTNTVLFFNKYKTNIKYPNSDPLIF